MSKPESKSSESQHRSQMAEQGLIEAVLTTQFSGCALQGTCVDSTCCRAGDRESKSESLLSSRMSEPSQPELKSSQPPSQMELQLYLPLRSVGKSCIMHHGPGTFAGCMCEPSQPESKLSQRWSQTAEQEVKLRLQVNSVGMY